MDLRAERHYADCTLLLTKYHKRGKKQPELTIPLLDVRPVVSASAEIVGQEKRDIAMALEEVTKGNITRMAASPGSSHFNMLLGEHATHAAKQTEEFLVGIRGNK